MKRWVEGDVWNVWARVGDVDCPRSLAGADEYSSVCPAPMLLTQMVAKNRVGTTPAPLLSLTEALEFLLHQARSK